MEKVSTHFGVEESRSCYNSLFETSRIIAGSLHHDDSKDIVDDKKQNTKVIIPDAKLKEPEKIDNTAIIDVEPIKVEPAVIKVKPSNGDVINMAERKTCPVEVVANKSKESLVKVGKEKKSEFDESLNLFMADLDNKGIKFSGAKRVASGLVEVKLIQNNGNIVIISVDIDNKIYGAGYVVFFIGKVPAFGEYNSTPIVLNDQTINAVINNVQIDPKFYVPENLVILNRMVDITSLKETNKKKREKVLAKTAKALETLNDEIVQAAAGEPFRFSFAKYKSEDNFALVSSKRNVVSNLSDEKLITDKEIWIKVEKESATLNYNPKK